MTKLQLSKLHATGNDFLVRVALDAAAARGRRRDGCRACATATAVSAPTG